MDGSTMCTVLWPRALERIVDRSTKIDTIYSLYLTYLAFFFFFFQIWLVQTCVTMYHQELTIKSWIDLPRLIPLMHLWKIPFLLPISYTHGLMDEEYFCNSKLKKIEKVKISFLPSSSYTHGLMAEGYFHNLKL